jgi:hypothetical protein
VPQEDRVNRHAADGEHLGLPVLEEFWTRSWHLRRYWPRLMGSCRFRRRSSSYAPHPAYRAAHESRKKMPMTIARDWE